jgi:exopolysaccharide biosynthesis protein
MKKYISIFLAAAMVFSSSLAGAETIYENVTEETVTKGVTYEKISMFSEFGWTRANVIKIDLTDPNPSVRVLVSPEGSSHLSTVMTMAETSGAKAAVNGDFFNFSSGETNMLGMVYQDGTLISTPAKDNQPSFILTEDNKVLFDYFSFSGTLIADNTSLCDYYSTTELYQVNKKPLTTGAITMITSAWGNSVSVPSYCYAMVTEPSDEEGKYRMTSYSWGGESVSIPQGGAVFIANYQINGFLNTNFAIGDEIGVEFSITPDVGKIKEASGGNTVIVKDGQVYPFTNNITGNNQRTAMGLSKSGNTLVLVTIDGRESDCVGMTQTQLAEFMIALGCDSAINFDGGGSTTMVAENRMTGSLEVKNSVSSLRKVSTAVGVFSSASSNNVVSGGKMTLSSDAIVLGDSTRAEAVFYDENFNNISSSVVYSCSDPYAVINGNKIMPTSVGEHTIYATSGSVTLESKITVLDNIFAINVYPEVVSTDSADKALTVTAYDRSGKSAVIDPSLVTFTPSASVSLSGNTVKKGSGKGTVTAQYNSLTSICVVNGEKYERGYDEKANDSFEGTIPYATEIAVTGELSAKKLIGRFSVNKTLSALNGQDVYALSKISDPMGILSFYRNVNGFTERTIDNTKIVTISNSTSSSFRLTDSSAWGKLKTVCENLTEKNLIIMTNSPIYKMNDGEQEVFNSFTEKLAENGKNVFVVTCGEKSEVTVNNNVRYIYLGSLGQGNIASVDYDTNTNKFVKFYISGDNIRYNFE